MHLNPTSLALRRKLAVLEGVELEPRTAAAIDRATVERAAEVPICCEKVLSVAMGWDDTAVADFLEAILDVRIQRLQCRVDCAESAAAAAAAADGESGGSIFNSAGSSLAIPPGHEENDTLVVHVLTDVGAHLTVHIRGATMLLASTDTSAKTMHNAMLASTFHYKEDRTRPHHVVCVTVAKQHPADLFRRGYEEAAAPAAAYVKTLRLGPAVEPWCGVRFLFVSLQEFTASAEAREPCSRLGAWCWFLSQYATCGDPARVPACVAGSPYITALWRRLALLQAPPGLRAAGSGETKAARAEAFYELWGRAAIAGAVNMQDKHVEQFERRSAEAANAMQQRAELYRQQMAALDKM